MPSLDKRRLIVIFLTSLIVFETIAYITTNPPPREQFFQLYLLGANRKLSDYYPKNDPNIRPRDYIQWYMGATNFMGKVQLVAIRVKLGNQTIRPPDDIEGQPSPSPMITEFRRFIQNNETWEFPFFWRVANVDSSATATRVLRFEINNRTYQVGDLSARNGQNFRLIIELWTLDMQSGDLQFGWFDGTARRVAWLQVWFNVTLAARR